MIVRTIQDITGTGRDIRTDTFSSKRLLLAGDGMGFSFHETTIFAGTETPIWYKNHVEAVYCVEGEGEIEVIDGETHRIFPGMMYALNGHERHVLRAHSELRLLCVFNPPVTGREVHDKDGVYPLVTREGG